MKTEFKNFIFNGLTYGIIFFVLSFIVGYVSFHLSIKDALLISTLMGVITLVLNGFVQGRFTRSSKTLNAITCLLNDDEDLVMAAPANHIVDDHLISGKLFLTEKRLLFKSVQDKDLSWLLSEFSGIKFYPSIFNTGGEFIIEHIQEQKLVFEVDEIRKWKKVLSV